MEAHSLYKKQLAKQLAELREQIIRELDELRESVSTLESSEEKRRELEEELDKSEVRNRAILDTAVEGIITINESGIIEIFNKAAEEIFGYSAEETIGKNVTILMPEPHASMHDEYIRNYLHAGKAKIIGIGREVTGRRKDGSIFPMDIAVSEVRLGDRRMFTGLVRDITEKKKLEQEKSDFIAMMTHDLKSPLVTILGYTELLAESKKDMLDAEGMEMVQAIESGGTKILNMVDDFLTISRLNSSPLQLKKSPVDIAEMMSGLRTEMGLVAKSRGVAVELGLVDIGRKAYLDSAYVERAVRNLLQNALNFSPKGARITIDVGTVKADGSGEFAVISVSDEGPGIPAEHCNRVFEMYFSIPPKPGMKGSGLGLSIVKAVAEAHGGRVVLESGQGTGCRFRLYLPLDMAEVQAA